jgi:hypothetical protein
LEEVEGTLLNNRDDIREIQTDLKEFDCRMKTLEYRALDQEARGRRQNVIFWGVDEREREDCDSLVMHFLRKDLVIDSSAIDDIVIQRAHRIGRPRDNSMSGKARAKPRPLIACFRDYKAVEMVMSAAHKLRGSPRGVSRDYPQEINAARKYLWPKYKRLKNNNENVAIRYPAKLTVNNVIVDDCFPNWDHFLRRKYTEGDAYADSHTERQSTDTRGSLFTAVRDAPVVSPTTSRDGQGKPSAVTPATSTVSTGASGSADRVNKGGIPERVEEDEKTDADT